MFRHDVIEQLSVEKGQCHHVTALDNFGVNGAQRLDCVGVEVFGFGHVVEAWMAIAHVVADEGEPHEGLMIRRGNASHRVHEL